MSRDAKAKHLHCQERHLSTKCVDADDLPKLYLFMASWQTISLSTDINRIDILASQDQCAFHPVSRFNAFQQSLSWGLIQQLKQNLTRTQPEKLPHPPFRPRVHPKPPGKMVGGAYIILYNIVYTISPGVTLDHIDIHVHTQHLHGHPSQVMVIYCVGRGV